MRVLSVYLNLALLNVSATNFFPTSVEDEVLAWKTRGFLRLCKKYPKAFENDFLAVRHEKIFLEFFNGN